MRPTGFLGALIGDLVAPVAVYYLSAALGAAPTTAMIVASLSCLPRQVYFLVRRRRLDGLGTAVIAGLVISILLALGTGDARVLAVKDTVWPLAAGVVTAASLLRGKPVSFYLFRPLLTQGQAANRPFWDEVWAGGASFRRCLRTLAVLWTVILFAAAAVELAAGLSLPLEQAGAVPGLVPVVAVPLLLGCTALYGKRTGLGVRAALAAVRPGPAEVGSAQVQVQVQAQEQVQKQSREAAR
jgi:hypothetical protein